MRNISFTSNVLFLDLHRLYSEHLIYSIAIITWKPMILIYADYGMFVNNFFIVNKTRDMLDSKIGINI